MKINLINCSEIKETRTYYNYEKINYILSNYRQKKSVKEKTGKGNPKKKSKSISKKELAAITRKTDKQVNKTSELSDNDKKRFKQIAGLPENLEYCN